MVDPATWLGIAVGLVLVLIGAYVAWLGVRVQRLEAASERDDDRGSP